VHKFSGKDLLSRIRIAAASLGRDELGFSPNELGPHSARSGMAMAMYLAGVPVFTIMLLGHWSSNAFLCYIRRQVQEFSEGVSQKLILNERVFTIPSNPCALLNHSLISHIGLDFKDMIQPLSNVFRQHPPASRG